MFTRLMLMLSFGIATSAVLAGPLDPPVGPIAPTQKPVGELETRTLINAANTPGDADSIFRIERPGSYYLGANIDGADSKHGIEIASDDVSIDLNGFTLRGAAGSLSGIAADGARSAIIIRNGFIRGWGLPGIDLRPGLGGSAVIIDRVHTTDNGSYGISTPNRAIVANTIAENNFNIGIFTGDISVVSRSVARGNTLGGIATGNVGIVHHAVTNSNPGGGIIVASASIVFNSASADDATSAISIGTGSSAILCTALNSTNNGIVASLYGLVRECRSSGHGGPAFQATSNRNRFELNLATDSLFSYRATVSFSFYTRNAASDAPWFLPAMSRALVVNAATAPAVNGNAGGTAPGSTDPNANFSY